MQLHQAFSVGEADCSLCSLSKDQAVLKMSVTILMKWKICNSLSPRRCLLLAKVPGHCSGVFQSIQKAMTSDIQNESCSHHQLLRPKIQISFDRSLFLTISRHPIFQTFLLAHSKCRCDTALLRSSSFPSAHPRLRQHPGPCGPVAISSRPHSLHSCPSLSRLHTASIMIF